MKAKNEETKQKRGKTGKMKNKNENEKTNRKPKTEKNKRKPKTGKANAAGCLFFGNKSYYIITSILWLRG